jgi:hypothetical protein
MLMVGLWSGFVLVIERVSAVTSKPEAMRVLMRVGPMLPFGPATATFLIVNDISEYTILGTEYLDLAMMKVGSAA